MRKISVQAEDFDLATELALHRQSAGDLGAVVTFTGLCRSDGGTLQALELEHFPGMAEEEIGRVVEEAETRWPLLGLTVIHRFGRIAVGEQIVLVITASAHRQAAFEAADFLMDYLKTRAPFWKKEWLKEGASSGWVEAKAQDDAQAERWQHQR
jgi:molybdopterin synthase catalytic subunit